MDPAGGGGGTNVDSSSKAAGDATTNCWCETKLNVVNLFYKWTIDNFSRRPEENGEFLMTPEFSATEVDQVKWSLKLYPKGQTEDVKDHLSLFLKLTKSDTPKVSANFRVSIIDKNGKEASNLETPHCFQKDGPKSWGWAKFILLDTLKGNGMLHGDKLTLVCKVSIIRDTLTVSGISGGYRGTKREALSKDLGDLLGSKRLSDVVLLVCGQEFNAHKAVLAARSPVFSAMFESDMKEKMTSRVEISDIAPEVFHELLEYIYTGKCNNTKELAADLLAGANKYALNGLKTMCEGIIESGLKVETAADVLILADRYSASNLKTATLKFIAVRTKEVKDTPGWKSLMASDRELLAEVLDALT